jgi:hypothetical protein
MSELSVMPEAAASLPAGFYKPLHDIDETRQIVSGKTNGSDAALPVFAASARLRAKYRETHPS